MWNVSDWVENHPEENQPGPVDLAFENEPASRLPGLPLEPSPYTVRNFFGIHFLRNLRGVPLELSPYEAGIHV